MLFSLGKVVFVQLFLKKSTTCLFILKISGSGPKGSTVNILIPVIVGIGLAFHGSARINPGSVFSFIQRIFTIGPTGINTNLIFSLYFYTQLNLHILPVL